MNVRSRKRSKVENGIHESDDADSSDDGDEDSSEDPEFDLFEGGVKCLFCDTIYPDPIAVFNCCLSRHKFNIFDFPKSDKSIIDYIKLVNFIRSERNLLNEDGSVVNDVFESFLLTEDDSAYLQPVIENDLLLCFDFESNNMCSAESSGASEDSSENIQKECTNSSDCVSTSELMNWDKSQLVEEIMLLRRKLTNAEKELDESDGRLRKTSELLKFLAEDDGIAKDDSGNGPPPSKEDPDGGYFDSYDSLAIHEDMIKDKVRCIKLLNYRNHSQILFYSSEVIARLLLVSSWLYFNNSTIN